MAAQDIIDPAALATLLEMTGDDPAFLAEMIDTYLDDTPRLLGEMRGALASGDAAVVRRAAHALKSNSANFGAHTLAAICRQLEELSGTGALDGAGELFSALERTYRLVAPALQAARPTE